MTLPNEKVCEELFLIYAFTHVYRRNTKRLVIYAPTLNEENKVGYDAKIHAGCRELYLQFKRAKVNKSNPNDFYFEITQHQLEKLKTNYPEYSSFYVIGSFDNIALDRHQRTSRVPKFLDQYIAIPAHKIEDNTTKVYFCRECHQKSSDICTHLKGLPFYVTGTGRQNLKRTTSPYDWFFGSELFREFENENVGATIEFDASEKPYRIPSKYGMTKHLFERIYVDLEPTYESDEQVEIEEEETGIVVLRMD